MALFLGFFILWLHWRFYCFVWRIITRPIQEKELEKENPDKGNPQ